MNRIPLRLMACLLAASMTYGRAAAQQLPLGPFDGAPGAALQAGVPAGQLPARRASNRIARPIPQFSGAVEPSLSNPIPPRQTLNQPQLSPPTGMQSPSGQSPFGLPAAPQAARQSAPGAVDPITGLPLHLLDGPPQTATRQNLPQQPLTNDPLGSPFSIPGGVPLPQPAGRPLSGSPLGMAPRATPPLPQQISQVPPGTIGYPPTVQRTPGPILFEGRIESAPRVADSDFDWGSLDAPIPQLDPPLPEFGNGDGELDLYDIIEEYTGRATHSGIPAEPHMTHPDQRSWLRIEDWRTEVTWLAGTDDEIGIASARGSLGIGLAKIKGIVLRPTGAAYWLSGPVQTDLPSRVYDAELEATWMHRFNDRFRMHVSARGGIYSDFDTSDDIDKALRVSGTGIGAFEINPDLQLVAGVAYFNLGSVWA